MQLHLTRPSAGPAITRMVQRRQEQLKTARDRRNVEWLIQDAPHSYKSSGNGALGLVLIAAVCLLLYMVGAICILW